MTETWGRGRRFGVVPLAGGQIYWFATESMPAGSHVDDDLAAVADRYRPGMNRSPRSSPPPTPEALLRHDIYQLATPLPRCVKGCVVLLGDAAHAITPDLGQGAALALEDAVVLSAAMADVADGRELYAALDAYDHQRRPRTQQLVAASARYGRIAQWRNPLAMAARNTHSPQPSPIAPTCEPPPRRCPGNHHRSSKEPDLTCLT